MELIVKEIRRPREWYYYNGEYISKSGDKVFTRIKGEFLPCPEKINYQRKAAQILLSKNKRGLYRTQIDPVIEALWNDWQTRI